MSNNETLKFYQPTDRFHFWETLRSEILQRRYNKSATWNIPWRNWLIRRLVSEVDGNSVLMCSPIHFQQGNNIHIGRNFYSGANFVCIDHAGVYIGDNVMIAPNVTITTVSHPKIAEQRVFRSLRNTYEPKREYRNHKTGCN